MTEENKNPTQQSVNRTLRQLSDEVWHRKRLLKLMRLQAAMFGEVPFDMKVKELRLRFRTAFCEAVLRGAI